MPMSVISGPRVRTPARRVDDEPAYQILALGAVIFSFGIAINAKILQLPQALGQLLENIALPN